MRRFLLLLALLVPVAANAQLSVYVKLERDVFALYEPIPVVVSIQNYTGRDIELTSEGDASWLDFIVTDEHGQMIGAVAKLRVTEPLMAPAGRTVARKIDLIPLYDLRQHGAYQVQARVTGGATQALSAPVKFSIVAGQEIWHQTVGVRGEDKSKDSFRTYSLQTRRDNDFTILYVCVRDDSSQLVYGMLQLGPMIPLDEPETRVDNDATVHVLYCAGPHAYGYVRVDPQAKVIDRRTYSDITSRPRLISGADGSVVVRGGEQKSPRKEHNTNAPPAAVTPPAGS